MICVIGMFGWNKNRQTALWRSVLHDVLFSLLPYRDMAYVAMKSLIESRILAWAFDCWELLPTIDH